MDKDLALEAFARELAPPDEQIDLGRAALVMARVEYPELSVPAHVRQLDELAEAAPRGARQGGEVERLHPLREYLFEEAGFAGNREDYYDPRNSFLNDVLDRRLGIPITLSLLLIEVGQRVGLALEGVGLPGHFIASARLPTGQILLDPFNGGAILTPDACAHLVERAVGRRVPLSPAAFAPVSR
ncbi:MAG TPA: transglutaminase-like domain-containing protein, partial [Candidatus Limnocylindrales bacterium]|nr:transglutaminase-like domain-containing protein [Candidatus Limnocylindrales bacterium]